MSQWRRNERVRTPRLEPLEDRRLLANVTVGNLNDVVNGSVTSIAALVGAPGADGISLREAILAANADAAADVINFGPSVAGTIQLTSTGHAGEIVISNNLTINGPGAGVITVRAFAGTAAAGDGARIFNVSDGNLAAVKTVAISGLTLTGGDITNALGGAIRSYVEDLTLTACTITGNRVTNGAGGAVWQLYQNLTINACTISGNTAHNGGGIYAFKSTVNVTDSTISGNTSTQTFGGPSGGGIGKYSGSLTVTNSTISGNRANGRGGGIDHFRGTLVVRHSTITGNLADADNSGHGQGGGVFVYPTLTTASLDHTIVAGNLRQGSVRDDVNGSLTARYSLIGDNTGATITNSGGNQIGTGGAPIDPLLGPPSFNPGPMVTHALLAGSPAIDAGDPAFSSPLTSDQRGAPFIRVADGDGIPGARIDIGAYERQTLNAADLVVDILADENDFNYSAGDRSLREMIELGNASFDTTITFAPALTSGGPATILLTLGAEPEIKSSMEIVGPGASLLTIDSSGNDPTPEMNNGDGRRLLFISGGSDFLNVAISGLTLTGGDFGGAGAIRNFENLTVTNCTISGNSAGRGGAISTENGSLTVINSTISGNRSNTEGGGIYNSSGALTVINSTISGNSANIRGGGIFNQGSLTVRHSTITGNLADADNDGSGGGGGLFSLYGATSLDHTLVAGNLRRNSIRSDFVGVADARFSLIGDNSGAAIINNGGNQIGTSAMPIDPLLGPLANNGGPTFTHALLAGSPAIDAGDSAFSPPPTNDQRGSPFVRVAEGDSAGGAQIDIGAYERQAGSLVVSTLVDEDDGNYSAGDLSLREAVLLGAGNTATNIGFASSLTSGGPATINLTSLGDLAITYSVTITGPGAELLTIRAFDPDADGANDGDGSRVFDIDDGTSALRDVEIVGLTLTGGDVTILGDGGGAVFSREHLTISDSVISGNHASGNGGGIHGLGSITILRTTITGNSAGTHGGGLSALLASLQIQDSTISANSAADQGGGIMLFSGNLMLTDSTVKENTATGSGGGVRILNFGNWNGTVTRSTITGNSTNFNGGGLSVNAMGVTGSMSVTDSAISGNTAAMRGGGVSTLAAGTTIVSSTISGNSATVSGGGVFNQNTTASIRHSTITANTAPAGEGSGIGSQGNSTTHTVLHSTIVAGNTNSDVDSIVDPDNSFDSDGFNLIGMGDSLGAFNQPGDQTGVTNPMLGPLADNGGPTLTHALLAGSPAINAGDPAAVAGFGGVPLFDQRGSGFSRVAGGRIDIGAFELQAATPSADFDDDDDVDGSDFLAWQRGLGASGAAATRANGNADGDGDVDGDDLAAWKSQFGLPSAVAAAVMENSVTTAQHPSLALPLKGRGPEDSMARVADAAFAAGDFTQLFVEHGGASRRKWRLPRRVG